MFRSGLRACPGDQDHSLPDHGPPNKQAVFGLVPETKIIHLARKSTHEVERLRPPARGRGAPDVGEPCAVG